MIFFYYLLNAKPDVTCHDMSRYVTNRDTFVTRVTICHIYVTTCHEMSQCVTTCHEIATFGYLPKRDILVPDYDLLGVGHSQVP